jgi:AhpD family alkylhydroperoxidase
VNQRLDFIGAAPEAKGPLFAAGAYLAKSALERELQILVSLRASQMNGCAFCIALHTREAEALGESSDRLHGLNAWREAPWYTARERAALKWTEVLTLLPNNDLPEDIFAEGRSVFSDRELVDLVLAITTINAWNRFNIAFRTSPELAQGVFEQLHPHAAV